MDCHFRNFLLILLRIKTAIKKKWLRMIKYPEVYLGCLMRISLTFGSRSLRVRETGFFRRRVVAA